MTVELSSLPQVMFPLLDKFYRAQRSHMRTGRAERVWVARMEHEIVAGVCLTPVEDGHWLTGLLVAPVQRKRGLAGLLLERVRSELEGPIWLFCHPDLQRFYTARGYVLCEALPETLAGRLARYQQSKSLVAMVSG